MTQTEIDAIQEEIRVLQIEKEKRERAGMWDRKTRNMHTKLLELGKKLEKMVEQHADAI